MILFHHAHGLTRGVQAFADKLREAGHEVHVPDLYGGNTFALLGDGVGYAREVGFDVIVERGRAAAERLPEEIVYAGISLGVLPAQSLAQTRTGAKGALLISAAIPPAEFGAPWPQGVPLQIHVMEDDELAAEDLEAARQLASEVDDAELYMYSGDRHLFADRSLADYDEPAANLLTKRVLSFLEKVD